MNSFSLHKNRRDYQSFKHFHYVGFRPITMTGNLKPAISRQLGTEMKASRPSITSKFLSVSSFHRLPPVSVRTVRDTRRDASLRPEEEPQILLLWCTFVLSSNNEIFNYLSPTCSIYAVFRLVWQRVPHKSPYFYDSLWVTHQEHL